MNRRILVFNTHIEVYPYEKGENRTIEDSYSVFDPVFFKMTPIAYYINENILYLPRGTNLSMLEKQFNSTPAIVRKHDPIEHIDINPLLEPKSRIQKEAVEFLSSEGRFSAGVEFSQLSLNLDTGDGKTIGTILAIAREYKCKFAVILEQTKLKRHWTNEIIKASDITEDEVFDVVGAAGVEAVLHNDVNAKVYVMNHQTLHGYGNTYGWEHVKEFFLASKIGVKVFDEAHKYFSNMCMIDFFSNTKKTIYLTATFTRNQQKEKIMFKRAFANTYRFGEETLNYEEKRKHTIYYYVTFSSFPDYAQIARLYGKYSVSSYKYIDYALEHDENHTLLKILDTVFDKVKALRGKILIITPKIESTEFIAEFIRKRTTRSVGVVNSKHTDEDNEEISKTYEIISSTMKSLGTGVDIKGLRVIINMEPFTSETNMRQLKGRLREFSPTDDTFLFDLVDIGIPDISKMGENRKTTMQKYQKEMRTWTIV